MLSDIAPGARALAVCPTSPNGPPDGSVQPESDVYGHIRNAGMLSVIPDPLDIQLADTPQRQTPGHRRPHFLRDDGRHSAGYREPAEEAQIPKP